MLLKSTLRQELRFKAFPLVQNCRNSPCAAITVHVSF